ncbi:transposase [Streptomyces avidinii]|uniref:Transposase n=1 Tax=Streptomyces avidinii TaxID=1895 RepID=A0ABS4KX83_STRAV|nr:transposase [Streptomyces avidinii]
MVNAVLYRTRTGIPWRDLPERHGSWQTVYERHRRWSADGTWSKILRALQAGADATALDQDGSWAVTADSTTCRAHQLHLPRHPGHRSHRDLVPQPHQKSHQTRPGPGRRGTSAGRLATRRLLKTVSLFSVASPG